MLSNSKTHRELAELLVQAQEGNKNAFEEIYSATVKQQYFLALKTLNDGSKAEDVTQEVFVYLFGHMKDIRNPIALISYMNKANYHLCLSILGKERQGIGFDENMDVRVGMDKNSNESLQDLLETAMFDLDLKTKEVIDLKYIQEFKTSEIAKYMNISQRTVQRIIKDGLREMKKSLQVTMGRQYSMVLFCLPLMGVMMNRSIQNVVSSEVQIRMFIHIANELSLPITGVSTATVLAGTLAGSATTNAVKGIVIGTTTITGAVYLGAHIVSPQFRILEIGSKDGYSIANQYQIQPGIGSEIREVVVYDESMNEYLNFKGDGGPDIYIATNGKYTIKVFDKDRKTSEKVLVVKNIDNNCPNVDIRYEDENVVIGINDSESGIDFETLRVTNEYGEVSYSIDKVNNEVAFSNVGNTQMSVRDMLGNETVIKINMEER